MSDGVRGCVWGAWRRLIERDVLPPARTFPIGSALALQLEACYQRIRKTDQRLDEATADAWVQEHQGALFP